MVLRKEKPPINSKHLPHPQPSNGCGSRGKTTIMKGGHNHDQESN